MSNLPLSFCESELTRQYTNLPAVVVDTLHVNMEIKRFLKPHEEDLEKVLMRKLRALKEAAKLRPETPLPPVLRQETRSTHRSLQMLLEEMKDIESISKKLQSDGLTLLQARELFDRLLELKPSFASYLASNAEIVHSPAFESSAVKVLDKKAEMLTREERAAILPFKLSREAAAAQPARMQK
ncbi:hypothetical protein PC116_g16398 [Phytophthora cactorum]|nr:hypothetical protein PC116_g16398 [Phytophthora cactorum]